jgi:ABC-type Mn2+/Zn2+ transport system permease subunit
VIPTADPLLTLLSHPFLQRAIVAAVVTSTTAATAGTFMVFRGLSFMSSGVAHAALGGAAFAIFLQSSGVAPWFDPILGAVLFGIAVAVLTGFAGESGVTAKMEVAIGVSFAFAMSLAVFFMYYIPPDRVPLIWGYIIGDPLLLRQSDLILLAASGFILVVILVLFSKEFTYVTLDMEGSLAHGMNARFYHYLLLIVSALAISAATKAVGAILVYAIMVAPAAAANEWGNTVREVMTIVFFIALGAQLAGLAGSLLWNISPSALGGILAASAYLVALVFSRR